MTTVSASAWLLIMLVTAAADDFHSRVEPVLKRHCLGCHSHAAGAMKGGLALDSRSGWAHGGDSGPAIMPGKPVESLVIRAVRRSEGVKAMPPKGAIPEEDIRILEEWIRQGAADPRVPAPAKPVDWWSLRPLAKPEVPSGFAHPVDAFIATRLARSGLKPSPEADRATLIRRLHADLTGLPPTRAEIEAFVADPDPAAYGRLVDRLLASPRHAERWARHWLDVVHFAETHGYEHDLPRNNAWRYRDHVIESFHADKPWGRFIREQLAADHFFPGEIEARRALGFLGAGPFDHSAYTTARATFEYLDRDDLVNQTMTAFASTTASCARCHAHKFDPISQDDYYSLQAVFAGVVEGDIPLEVNAGVAGSRARWTSLASAAKARDKSVLLSPVNEAMAEESLGAAKSIRWTVLAPDSWKGTGGTTLERLPDQSLLAKGPRLEKDTYEINFTLPPGKFTAIRLEVLAHESLPMRGPGRCDNGNLHLSEFEARVIHAGEPAGEPVKFSSATADFDQSGWDITRAIDGKAQTAWGIHPDVGRPHSAVFTFGKPMEGRPGSRLAVALRQLHGGGHLIGRPRLSLTTDDPRGALILPEGVERARALPRSERTEAQRLDLAAFALEIVARRELAALPESAKVYAAGAKSEVVLAVGSGSAQETPRPRQVFVLRRGDLDKPGAEAMPGSLSAVAAIPARFGIPKEAPESARRAALADWLASHANPLTWRSIANRVWQHHFGRGICDTPGDFGRMGGEPSHPELLDWLACRLRDNGESLRDLHRVIVMSATYRQVSANRAEAAAIDGDNRLLWRQNRRRLDADAYRDGVLSVSGCLDLTMGGPGAREFSAGPPVQLTPRVDYGAFDWASKPEHRRAIYRFVWRGIPDPFMEVLDFPDLGLLTPARASSSSALQALALYNNKFTLHFSGMLGKSIDSSAKSDSQRAREAWSRVLGRLPDAREAAMAEQHVARHGAASLCRVLFNSHEFLFVE
ncbi:MAG: DUF1553 domain-containing protein [Planctomycetes bacterium]|nr:DUF1553 domain-containing protein [Planctomycetota bacterium]